MNAQLETGLGKVHYDEHVLAELAGLYAMDNYGIVGMASKRATDGIVELLGRENLRKGVQVVCNGGEITVNLFVLVEYGVSIVAVASNTIDNIKFNLEKMTGLRVAAVNITVEDIRV